jgi:hypothetical protein
MGVQHTDRVFKALAQAIKALGFVQPIEWHELQGGRSNRLFWGQFPDGKLVFKFFDELRSNLLFPNDVLDERRALISLMGTYLAPEFRGCVETEMGSCIVYGYVDGAVLPQATAKTIEALSQLHSHKAQHDFRRIPSDPAIILDHGMSLLGYDDSSRAKWLRTNAPAVPKVKTSSPCFLHGDPTPANSVQTTSGITFIDWQCPAIGDPVHDLAIALSSAMHVVDGSAPLSLAQVENLLGAYSNAEVAERYLTTAPLYRWRMACYCHWKARAGEAEFTAAGVAEFS